MDSISRFSGRAEHYEAARPAYAHALLQRLDQDCHLPTAAIADVGSGTGKLSRQLLEQGSQVFGVEPNQDMRQAAERSLAAFPRFRSVNGTAEHTTLDSGSVDLVTAAQAFHWFQPDAFLQECRRILRPGGSVALIWNLRDMGAPVNQAWADLCRRYCPDFQGFTNGLTPNDPHIRGFFPGECRYCAFPHPLYYDWEGFLRRCLSSSFSLREGDGKFLAYQDELAALFQKFARQGVLELPNETVAYLGSV